jgi:divinyl protochlorophyllide a 8-vinyl-reductase
VRLGIAGSPLCRDLVAQGPACDYYAAAFEVLFRTLVHPNARLRETLCEASGARGCVFEISW